MLLRFSIAPSPPLIILQLTPGSEQVSPLLKSLFDHLSLCPSLSHSQVYNDITELQLRCWEESHSPGSEACCVTSGDLLNLSDSQFPHLYIWGYTYLLHESAVWVHEINEMKHNTWHLAGALRMFLSHLMALRVWFPACDIYYIQIIILIGESVVPQLTGF